MCYRIWWAAKRVSDGGERHFPKFELCTKSLGAILFCKDGWQFLWLRKLGPGAVGYLILCILNSMLEIRTSHDHRVVEYDDSNNIKDTKMDWLWSLAIILSFAQNLYRRAKMTYVTWSLGSGPKYCMNLLLKSPALRPPSELLFEIISCQHRHAFRSFWHQKSLPPYQGRNHYNNRNDWHMHFTSCFGLNSFSRAKTTTLDYKTNVTGTVDQRTKGNLYGDLRARGLKRNLARK